MSPSPPRLTLQRKLQNALRDIITGHAVKRSKHDLTFDGISVVNAFVDELVRHGYQATTVAKVDVREGERVPAFYIEDTTAYFGWVFWEKFTSSKMRKLWGSVVRNGKGDWAIQLTPMKASTIYANPKLKTEMDIDHPSEAP